ncbi:hypothetical protein [Micromonospora sp. NPDC005413]|uniref:hypothetical protein n=1 Tax=Micromonospora sp. NPDC005413 TaxID=3154563 RepID=UPI0033A4F796
MHDPAGLYLGYQRLTPAQVRELSDAINGLAEPVSRLAAVVSQRFVLAVAGKVPGYPGGGGRGL